MPTFNVGDFTYSDSYFVAPPSTTRGQGSYYAQWTTDTDDRLSAYYNRSTYPRDYYSDYMSSCTCGACRDAERYANGEYFVSSHIRTPGWAITSPANRPATVAELNEHFTHRPLYQPRKEFIKLMTELNEAAAEVPVPNPLPEPNIITIRNRAGGVFTTITADTLVGHDFSGQNLNNADFRGMDLRRAKFNRCQLERTIFADANLTGASFQRSYIYDSDWTGVNAKRANLSRSSFDYVNVSGANFTNAKFDAASIYSLRNFASATWTGISIIGTSGVYRCNNCDAIEFYSDRIVYCQDTNDHRCRDCGWDECHECNAYFADIDEHNSECDARYRRFLHSWDFKPRRYRPKGNFPTEALMGVELEVGGDEMPLTKIVNDLDPSEQHLYCKRDGSVNGIEIVTHPMTLAWAKQSFDFKALINNLQGTGYTDTDFGLHVHVSRNAFSTYREEEGRKPQPTHQYAWLMFMYRNSDSISQLARRGSTGYSSWSKPNTRAMKIKASQPDSDTRYVAINCNNERTYEVRCFKTTLDFTEFMAAIEFVDASVNYTRGMTTANILRNQGMTWQSFFEWTATQGAKYSNLRKEMIKLTRVSYQA